MLAVLSAAPASAESEREAKAREELERQLKSMVGTPPTKTPGRLIVPPGRHAMMASFRA